MALFYIIINIPETNKATYTNFVNESPFIFLCTILLTTIAIITNIIVIKDIVTIPDVISPLKIFIESIIAFNVAHKAHNGSTKSNKSFNKICTYYYY